jgi:hypothetical protein
LIIALALLVAGCSAGPARVLQPAVMQPQASGMEATQMVGAGEYQELVALDSQVEMLSSQQECGAACDAGARLCALSDRICDIAIREPDPEIEGRCVDGRERCSRARERLLAICGCAPPEPLRIP